MLCSPQKLTEIKEDNNYVDLGGLPSRFIPYTERYLKGRVDPFDQILTRRFRFPELSLISMAATTDDVSHIVRAVDNVISVPVGMLTIQDYFYVLMWLKTHNYPKTPLTASWKCEQKVPFYNGADQSKQGSFLNYAESTVWPSRSVLMEEYELRACDTENTEIIYFSDLTVKEIREDAELGDDYDFPRAHILPDLTAALADPAQAYLAPALQWIRGNTWAEKVARAEADETNELLDGAFALNDLLGSYGMSETITYTCRQCRVKHKHEVQLSASSFFR